MEYHFTPLENEMDLHWYKSDLDGTIVVEISTDEKVDEDIYGPMIRVYLNDDVLFENPSYADALEN